MYLHLFILLPFIFATVFASQYACPNELPDPCGPDSAKGLPFRCFPSAADCHLSNSAPASTPFYCHSRPNDHYRLDPRGCCDNLDHPFSIAICPDGTCAPSTAQCAPLTCPSSHPILCNSGVCSTCIDDCPLHVCPAAKPIRCPDQSCTDDFWKCKCPEEAPYRCPNATEFRGPGFTTMTIECRRDVERCPHFGNFCNTWRPNRCDNGICVLGSCEGNEKTCSNSTLSLCVSSGFCVPDLDTCPLPNGCPVDSPIKCETGECRALPSQCPLPYRCMSSTHHIKCPTGECVSDFNQCPEIDPVLPHSQCHRSLPFFCSIGKCVEGPSLCPAILPCPCDRPFRWLDGLCRSAPDNDDGPAGDCPYPMFRCESGACVLTEDHCVGTNGCPVSRSFKCPFGTCVVSEEHCPTRDSTSRLCNGCTAEKPVKCRDGQCVFSEGECKLSNGCSYAQPYRCASGTCVANVEACPNEVFSCPPDQMRCADGSCQSSTSQCLLPNSCPNVLVPYRCMDGSCVVNHEQCPKTVLCPDQGSGGGFCDDGSPYTGSCRATSPCAPGTVRCPNGRCVLDFVDCPSTCPDSAPILCHGHVCVSDISHCYSGGGGGHWAPGGLYNYNHTFWDDREHFWGGGGGHVIFNGTGGWVSRFQPNSTADSIDFGDPTDPNWIFSGGWGGRMDDGRGACRGSTPFNCFDGSCGKNPIDCYGGRSCSEGFVLCSDGSCQSSVDRCLATQPCPFDRSKRCADGKCVAVDEPCGTRPDDCEEGQSRCADGKCRETCPAANGCDLNAPVFCSNGVCAFSVEACTTGCVIHTVNGTTVGFKCIDGTCGHSPLHCLKPAPHTIKSLCSTYTRTSMKPLDEPILSLYDELVVLGHFNAQSSVLVDGFFMPLPIDLCTLVDSEIRKSIANTSSIVSPVVNVSTVGGPRSIQSSNFTISLILPAGMFKETVASDYCLAYMPANGTIVSPKCVNSAAIDPHTQMFTSSARDPGAYFFALKEEISDGVCPGHLPHKCRSGACALSPSRCPMSSSAAKSCFNLILILVVVLLVWRIL
ncbi:hypothetical protein RCL1_006010 [Eukaryota sp. TZLM3-RCL]